MGRRSRRKQERKASPPMIVVNRNRDYPGSLPPFIMIAQRQFEKSKPEPIRRLGSEIVTFHLPVDIFRMIVPAALSAEVESIEISYRHRGGQ